tara:strand:+ start:3416 stop:3973 length:558 start_codon:yes stop_codon:yes gene_type:complete
MAKNGPQAKKFPYDNKKMTIKNFIQYTECIFVLSTVEKKLKAGKTLTDVDKESKSYGKNAKAKTGRIAKTYPFAGDNISLGEFVALEECIFSIDSVRHKLRSGKTMDEIIKIKEHYIGRGVSKIQPVKKMNKRPTVDIALERRKAIMSVPINPKYQSAFYMPKTTLCSGEQSPTRLSSNGYMGRV